MRRKEEEREFCVLFDLTTSISWLNIAGAIYANPSNAQKGIVGKMHGVTFKTSNNSTTQSSTVTVYHNFIYGANSYGIVDIAGNSDPKVILKTPGPQDTSNPLNMFSTIGWKVTFASKVLNASWVVNLKTGATA